MMNNDYFSFCYIKAKIFFHMEMPINMLCCTFINRVLAVFNKAYTHSFIHSCTLQWRW